jgi:hybrid cluster-associated redox disulfide protein
MVTKKQKNKDKITKEMGIQEVAEQYPDAVSVLMEEGMHCIGCMAARFETLEQGLCAHGKSDKEVEEILVKMNKVVSDEE